METACAYDVHGIIYIESKQGPIVGRRIPDAALPYILNIPLYDRYLYQCFEHPCKSAYIDKWLNNYLLYTAANRHSLSSMHTFGWYSITINVIYCYIYVLIRNWSLYYALFSRITAMLLIIAFRPGKHNFIRIYITVNQPILSIFHMPK